MKRIFTAAIAVFLISGAGAGAASAQPHDDHRGSDDHHGSFDHRGGPHHNWRRGGRIDRDDWSRGQRFDYRAHHLRRPPRGYEWREVDGNYVLAAVATGIIADILLNSH